MAKKPQERTEEGRSLQTGTIAETSVNRYTAKTQYGKFETNTPEKELRSLSPNFHIHVSVSDLYIPIIGLPILLQENMWTNPRNI